MANKLHILILEDSPEDLEIEQRLLRRVMVDVMFSVATNKEQYIDLLSQFVPDVILADNSLPQFDATQALMILRHRSLRVPFILVTGTVSEEFAAGIIKLGADDYILKDRLYRLPSAIEGAINQCKAENERLTAHSKLLQSEERYRTLIERITDGFISIDANWLYTYVNKQAGILIHKDPSSLIGKNVWEVFPEAIGSATYEDFHRAMNEQRYICNIDYFEPLELWQENHIYPSPDGLSVFIRDITIRKKAEDEILKMNKELHTLSSHLQNVREQERIHIAREIHDELGQQLTGLKMDMYWLQKKLVKAEETIQEKIKTTVELVDHTVISVRRIASELRPSMLDDLDLLATLEWHARQVQERSGIEVIFNSTIQELNITIETATGIFRIYQEALTNVVRHSKATTVDSSLEISGNALKLIIADDGKGMDVAAVSQGKTLGILGIKERTYILGGTFELKSAIGEGTQVVVTVPYFE